jgi:hypothetical protein
MSILRTRERWERKRSASRAKNHCDLTPEEQANVSKALRVLRHRYASWRDAATALDIGEKTLTSAATGKRKASAGMALRVSRAAGVSMEELLAGAWPKPGACPMCGRCEI